MGRETLHQIYVCVCVYIQYVTRQLIPGADFFLKSQSLTEHESLVACFYEPSTCPCSKPHKCVHVLPCCFKIQGNVVCFRSSPIKTSHAVSSSDPPIAKSLV